MRPLKKRMQRVIVLPDGETYELFNDCFYADLTEEQIERLQNGEDIDSLLDDGLKLYPVGDDDEDEDEDEYDD